MGIEKVIVVGNEWIIPAAHADRKIGGSTDPVENEYDYAHLVCHVRGKYQDDAENARRLAACWNFCLDIGTEGLESIQGGLHELLTQAADEQQELGERNAANQDLLVQLGAMRVLLTQVVELNDADCIATGWDHCETTTSFDILIDRIRDLLK